MRADPGASVPTAAVWEAVRVLYPGIVITLLLLLLLHLLLLITHRPAQHRPVLYPFCDELSKLLSKLPFRVQPSILSFRDKLLEWLAPKDPSKARKNKAEKARERGSNLEDTKPNPVPAGFSEELSKSPFGDELSKSLFYDGLCKWPFGDGLGSPIHDAESPSGDELLKLPLPKELSKARKKEAKKTEKRGKKANRVGDYGYATVHVTPKAHENLNLVPAGLSRPDIHGMINYEIKVLEFLECGSTSLLGISGKRGIGKTTLLRLVRTSSRHDPSFHYVFYVDAGIGFTACMLQGVLARNIGLGPMPAVPEVKRISSFLRVESFILLIDDVRVSFDLAAAGLPMPLGPRQKVVFTTRDESICTEMGSAGNNIRVECLGEDTAWDLFRYNAGGEAIDADSEIKELAKKMVAECQGIPGALCTIGRSMATERDVRHWRVAYEMLMVKRPPLNEIEEIGDEGYPRLDFFKDELADPFYCIRCPKGPAEEDQGSS